MRSEYLLKTNNENGILKEIIGMLLVFQKGYFFQRIGKLRGII